MNGHVPKAEDVALLCPLGIAHVPKGILMTHIVQAAEHVSMKLRDQQECQLGNFQAATVTNAMELVKESKQSSVREGLGLLIQPLIIVGFAETIKMTLTKVEQ